MVKVCYEQIDSATLKEIRQLEDPDFIGHAVRAAALRRPFLVQAYGSTLKYNTYSSQFAKNHKIYEQKVLFEDFAVLAKDQGISIKEAIAYALENGDAHVRCTCPSFLYHGFAYIGTVLDFIYGLPKEGRAPHKMNPGEQGSVCKHLARVLRAVAEDKSKITSKFEQIYKKSDKYVPTGAEKPIEKKVQPQPEKPTPEAEAPEEIEKEEKPLSPEQVKNPYDFLGRQKKPVKKSVFNPYRSEHEENEITESLVYPVKSAVTVYNSPSGIKVDWRSTLWMHEMFALGAKGFGDKRRELEQLIESRDDMELISFILRYLGEDFLVFEPMPIAASYSVME
jgi:hypothetical protein